MNPKAHQRKEKKPLKSKSEVGHNHGLGPFLSESFSQGSLKYLIHLAL
jgi:hypothetical protein